jgi:hypothetical protein
VYGPARVRKYVTIAYIALSKEIKKRNSGVLRKCEFGGNVTG